MGILQPGYPGEPLSHGDTARRGCLTPSKTVVLEYVNNTFMAIFANKETLDRLWLSKDSSVTGRLGKD